MGRLSEILTAGCRSTCRRPIGLPPSSGMINRQSLECRHDPFPADIEETKSIANLPTSSQVKHVHGEIVGNPDRRLQIHVQTADRLTAVVRNDKSRV